MYAIIETGGKQFKVRRDGRVRVPSLTGEVGDRVTFDRVLCASDGGDLRVGAPLVQGVRVVGEIVRHGRGKKIVVFRMKRRHRFRKKQGHRQDFTEIAIRELALDEDEPERRADEAGTPPPSSKDEELGAEQSSGPARQVGPYVCDDCGRGFATERGLQQHRAKAHVE
ncbi:MAG: 50S ribosomal protein L21 [Gemmatimonadota bacterium]